MDLSDNFIRVGSQQSNSNYYTKDNNTIQTPDSKKLNLNPSFDLKNVPMTMKAMNRQLGSRPNSNSQWDMALMMISSTHHFKDVKRSIANAKDLLQMIAKGELLNCYVCLSRPVEHYCNYCESSLCTQCMLELAQRNSPCPHCRHKEPILIDMKINKQVKRIVKRLKKLVIVENDIQKAFKCKICKNLMMEPKSCSDCQTHFCQSCIQNKLCTDNRCIECKKISPNLRKLHKCLLEILDKALITCRFCNDDQRYIDLLNHEIECKFKNNASRRGTAQNRQKLMNEGLEQQLSSEKKSPKRNTMNKQVRQYLAMSRKDSRSGLNLTLIEDQQRSFGQDMQNQSNISDYTNIQQHLQKEFIMKGTDLVQLRQKANSRQQYNTNASFMYPSGDSEVQKLGSENYQQIQSPPTGKSSFVGSAKQSFSKQQDMDEKNDSSSEDQDSDAENEEYYDENGDLIENFEYDQYDIEQNHDQQSPGLRFSLTKRQSMGLKKLEIENKTYCQSIKEGLSSWGTQFKENVDYDNCSSNSVIFYIMFLICGAFEMFFSLCLYFDFQIIQNSKPNIEPYIVSYPIFAIGLLIEFVFWLLSRIYLGKSYLKYHAFPNQKCYNLTTIFSTSILSILPCDMLIFFGYSGDSGYEKKLLNFAWLRRLISVIRIIFQIVAVTGMLRGEFVTTVFCCQILYMVMLLTAIFPQKSDYDAFTWYRRV